MLMTNPDNSSREVYRGQECDCVVAGLLPGRYYLFQVRANNKTGVSIYFLVACRLKSLNSRDHSVNFWLRYKILFG